MSIVEPTAIQANGTPPTTPQPTGKLPPAVAVHNIFKSFGDNHVLKDVSLHLRPGSFRALLGENGAGKSTLVKCVMGTYRPDKGKVVVGDSSVELKNPRQAHALGIGMVYQHFTLVENMTVVENMVMARGHIPAIVNWKKETLELDEFMSRMPFRVDPKKIVGHLSAGEKQKAELLKQLYLQRKVLILDEPTSVLTPDEADEMLGMVRKMCVNGEVSVLIITHKFREVMAFCDEVTVLRHGAVMGEGAVKDLTPPEMAKMMMGTATPPEQAVRAEVPADAKHEPRLIIDELKANNEGGLPAVRGLSLKVKPHEIVGIAGISGNGQRELVQVLAGQRDPVGGVITLFGERFKATREEMRKHNFHVLPEMPLQNACVGIMTTGENMAFRKFDRQPMTLAKWFLNPRAVRTHAESLISRYGIKPNNPTARIGNLSGGNVQRAVLARELGDDTRILIAANPCFGLDFKAVAEIRSKIMEARNRGCAVLLVSEDLDEILELADRILVISDGKIVYETPASSAERQTIGRYMGGQH